VYSVRKGSELRDLLVAIGPSLDQHIHLASADHTFGVCVFVVEIEMLDVCFAGTQHFTGFGPNIRFDAPASNCTDK